jgi:hypothetical protein
MSPESFAKDAASFANGQPSLTAPIGLVGRGNIAHRLSDLPTLCGYPIDFRNERTYLFRHAEATPES